MTPTPPAADVRFRIEPLSIPGASRIARRLLADERGHLSRLFCAEALAAAGWVDPVAQLSVSVTDHAGCLRGLHLALPPSREAKLVACVRGAVYDVVLDLRADSPRRGHWDARILRADEGHSMLVPAGCAHGFQALEDDTILVYAHAEAHAPATDGGVDPRDPALGIPWPLPVTHLSARDRALPPLSELLR